MMATFTDEALKYVLENEGGYADVPGDSGGKTRYGITEAVARANGHSGDMRELPLEFAKKVYKDKYWSFDWIEDQRLAVKVFDAAVNFGPKVAVLLLQKCLFGPEEWDGIVGPKTRAATNNVAPNVLILAYADAMAERYQDLAVQPKNKKFLRGWLNRARRLP